MADLDNGVVYRNAPIVEAIISLHVAFREGDADKVAGVAEKAFSSRFARSQSLDRVNVKFESKPSTAPTSSLTRKHGGWKFTDEKNERVLQILPNAFVYSHLQPYTKWQTFSAEARELWQTYLKVANPTSVNRIGLRYINRLRLPERFELSDYLNFYPSTPPAFGELCGVVTQLQLQQADSVASDALALVTLASEPSQDPSTSAMALDIDIFSKLVLPASDSKIWDTFEDFRVRKNRLFEAAITEKLKEKIR